MLRTNPGDYFQIGVDAYYDDGYVSQESVSPDEMLSSLVTTLTGGHTYGGIPISELPTNVKTVQTLLGNPNVAEQIYNLNQINDDPTLPKAHLTYLFFNDRMELDMNYSGSVQVGSITNQTWLPIGPITTGSNNSGQTTIPGNGGPVIPGGFYLIYVDNQSIGKDVWFDNLLVEHYTSAVTDEDHYYPFGLALKLGSDNISPANPRKYNGIELEKHFGLEMDETFFRTHDPQLGRFNQIDPKFSYPLSPYAAMANNPVLFSDPLGDTTQVYSRNGILIGTVNDHFKNQIVFMSHNWPTDAVPWTLTDGKTTNANEYGQKFRDAAIAFIGDNTVADFKSISAHANKIGHESGFVATISSTRELRLTMLSDKYSVTTDNNAYNLGGAIQGTYSRDEQTKIFGAGHIHLTASSNVTSVNGFTGNMAKFLDLGGPTGGPGTNDNDYQPALYRNKDALYRGQSALFIGTQFGITVYGSGKSYDNIAGFATDKVVPSLKSYYLYKQIGQ